MLILKEKINRKSREYITRLGFDWHPDLNSPQKSHITAHLESQLGKVPKEHVLFMDEEWDFKDWSLGLLFVNPRPQTDSFTNLWPNCSSGFMLILFILSCETWNVVKPGSWLTRPPSQGLSNLKILPPSYLWCCKSCTHNRQSFPVTLSQSRVQVRNKVRGLLCFVSET